MKLSDLKPWVLPVAGLVALGIVAFLAVGYLNHLRSRADAAERKAEAAELKAQGFAVAADTSRKQLDATAASNQLLQAEVERLKKASPGAQVVGTLSGTTHLVALPFPATANGSGPQPPATPGASSPPPGSSARPCALYFDEPVEIRVDGAAMKTDGGNLVLAGVASLWVLFKGESEPKKVLDTPLTLKVQAQPPAPAPGWGAGLALVGFSGPGGGGWWAGPLVSPPSLRAIGLDLSLLVGGGVGMNGSWGGLAGGLARW